MTFALTTADPAFNPRKPVTVNGFLYRPAEPEFATAAKPLPSLAAGRVNKVVTEVKRRKIVERRNV